VDLDRFPRIALAHAPTPIEPLDNLTAVLVGPRLWVKRDDCIDLANGGNKTRKLVFLSGHASDYITGASIAFDGGYSIND
tara:strand:+ start:267 stop:506 length:240 start_codon:yes stop_codon:yes gene_type:complete